jgi:hypothetical protein
VPLQNTTWKLKGEIPLGELEKHLIAIRKAAADLGFTGDVKEPYTQLAVSR